MIDRNLFKEKYHVSEQRLEEARISWDDLTNIYKNYDAIRSGLEPTGAYIASRLREVPEVHSLKYRVKDSEHLVEKIVRKRAEGAEINIENYREKITDLVGVRALHLFKGDWLSIHHFITNTWDLAEIPTANIRRGDPDDLVKTFEENGCQINEHDFGYRSVHYLVKSKPAKKAIITEVQVRTIFEEGWSEIDHQIRYPYELDNIILTQFLVVFNRLSGASDEMGSFVKLLKNELDALQQAAQKAIEEKSEIIQQLKFQIEKLEIQGKEKEDLEAKLDSLSVNIPFPLASFEKFDLSRLQTMQDTIDSALSQSSFDQLQNIRPALFSRPFELSDLKLPSEDNDEAEAE